MRGWEGSVRAIWSTVRSRPMIVAAGIYGITSLVCTQVPLLNTLGYEFSFVIALASSLVSGFATISLIKPAYYSLEARTNASSAKHSNGDPEDSFLPSFFSSFLSVLWVNFLLLLVPLLLILLNGFFVPWCSVTEGLAFYCLLPVVSVWFSSTLALFCSLHYRRSRTVFFLLFAATIVYAGLLGYFTPAIFSYNFFYGFFPGLSYDELLTIDWTLILFRGITVLLGGLFLWLSMLLLQNAGPGESTIQKGRALLRALVRGHNVFVAVLAVVLLGGVYFFRCELGFESTASFIQKSLGGKIESPHFTIYYSPEAYSGREIRYVVSEHEFHYQNILSLLSLSHDEGISSYIYPSASSKHRFIGTGTTNIAKPWNREIHVTKQSLDRTLRHEMVHVLVGRFGAPVIRASTSTGLVEGVAMAIEDDPGNRTLHQYAAAMRRFGVAPDIRRLMTPLGFVSQASSVSYVLAGSLCRYLIDTHGMRPLLQVYRNGDYETAFSCPLDTLVRDWYRFLDSVAVSDQDSGRIDAFFRGRPIFKKICPRVIARRVREADRLFAKGVFEESFAIYKETYAESGGMESLRGMMISLYRLKKYRSVVELLDSVRLADSHLLRYLTLHVLGGDAAWAAGDTLEARNLYTLLRDADIAEAFTEAARVRLQMLASPPNRQEFVRYIVFDGSDQDRLALLRDLVFQTGDTVVCRYLEGRLYDRTERYAEALQTLERVSWVPRDGYLERLRKRLVADLLLRLGRVEDAKMMLWSSLNGESNKQTIKEVNLAIDQCEWESSWTKE